MATATILLLYAGAVYISSWISFPFQLAMMPVFQGRSFPGQAGTLIIHSLSAIPVAIGWSGALFLAGLITPSKRRFLAASVAALVMLLTHLSKFRWTELPSHLDIAISVLPYLVAASVAFLAHEAGYRLNNRLSPAPVA